MSNITHHLADLRFGLGEGPIWDDAQNVLFWVDIKAPALHRYDPVSKAHNEWQWPEVISCCGLTQSGGLVVGGRSGLWMFDPATGAKSLAFPIPELPADLRTNDGKVGPDGAFWISTMQDINDRGPVGVLMRIACDGDVRVMETGLTTANGLEWSVDGRTLYMADTRTLGIDCYDYNPETISLTNRRRFITLGEGQGKPDGAATDVDGNYLIAGIYAGAVHSYTPAGKHLQTVTIPAEMVTMPCFGGADLKTVFVTSLMRPKDGVAGDGGLFSYQSDTAGPKPRRMSL